MKTSRLSLLAATFAIILALFLAGPASAKSQALESEQGMIAMPMTGRAAQQIVSAMKAEETGFNRLVAETQAQDDEAKLLFVVVTSEVMSKYRYSLDKTLAFIAARIGDDSVIDFLNKTHTAGIFGVAYQLLQMPGWGEKAVDMKIVSQGTLAAVRSTSAGKE